jgi:hypothetical protein
MSRSVNEARVLMKLLDVDTISMSNFSKDKNLIENLERLDVLKVFKNFGKRGSSAKKGNFFDKYIETQYNSDMQSFIDIDSRGELLKKFDDDKAKNIRPQTGIYLWTDDEVDIGSGNVISCQNGTCLFVHHTVKVEIDKDVLIIGIENFETLMNAINIKHFFDKDVKMVFMFRNLSFLEYIKNAKNKIAYFPDYDVYGVKIYETEILKYNQNVSMFVPFSFESDLISIDSKKRYFEDLASKGGKYMAVTEIGQFVLKINKKHHKVLPQEFYSTFDTNINRGI